MYYEEINEGDVYKSTHTKIITGTEIDLFAQMSGMDLPGFLDGDYARKWGFKDRVTPGAYIIASMFGLMAKHGFLADAVWVGTKDISLKHPFSRAITYQPKSRSQAKRIQSSAADRLHIGRESKIRKENL